MKLRLPNLLLGGVLFLSLALTAPAAFAQFVYVDDNNTPNTVTSFMAAGLMLVAPTPFPTMGNGLPGANGGAEQVVASYGTANCLFISDANASGSFPNGDIAAFVINGPSTVFVSNAIDPTAFGGANKGIPLAIDRRAGFPYLFAGFTTSNRIAFFKINPGTCQPVWVSSTPAVGVSGAPLAALAVSAAGPHIVIATYQDGSIQSFKVSGGTLIPLAAPFVSTGFSTQGGVPDGIDITANGRYAIFGDRNGIAEVEVSRINPTGTLTPTVDYGGPANASGIVLAPAAGAENVWLSPGLIGPNNYVYLSNGFSRQVTTIRLHSVTGVVTTIPSSSCVGPFTNPTTLNNPSGWLFNAGIQTETTTGTGNAIYVAEFGAPSSVASLKVQNTGCTREVVAMGSPFIDPFSNAATGVAVFPARPF